MAVSGVSRAERLLAQCERLAQRRLRGRQIAAVEIGFAERVQALRQDCRALRSALAIGGERFAAQGLGLGKFSELHLDVGETG